MDEYENVFEELRSGDTVAIENTRNSEISLSIMTGDDARLNMALAPGQVLDFTAGASDARIILREGDPAALLVVKPDTPS